jgi:ribosomal protein L6P/L9E
MGYIIPLKKRELLNTNEKIKENEINNIFKKETLEYAYRAEIKNIIKQIKNIIKGINQGFSINLELKGIGYTAKITENIINKLKSKERAECRANGYEACSENGERAEHEEKKNQKCGA